MITEERARVEVLLERIETDVRIIAEGHSALVARLDRTDARLERLEGRFDQLEIRVAVLDTKVDGLEARFDGLEGRFDGLEARSAETQHWVERIAAHLGLAGAPPPSKRPRRGATKRRKAS